MEDKRPRIAVVLTGLGLSDSATAAAIEELPSAVTLSFSPYARDLERWIALARARGHEVMLDRTSTRPNASHYCASRMLSSPCNKKFNTITSSPITTINHP